LHVAENGVKASFAFGVSPNADWKHWSKRTQVLKAWTSFKNHKSRSLSGFCIALILFYFIFRFLSLRKEAGVWGQRPRK